MDKTRPAQQLLAAVEAHASLRPRFHFAAPYGWMSDPCAPGIDKDGNYHLFYQWNPKGCDWANLSWGHSVSKDLVHWQRVSLEPALAPSEAYDQDGVFAGCLHPAGPHGEPDQLTAIYSSIRSLPIHWTQKHVRGSETISAAVSGDAGRTWAKLPGNPIVGEEPAGVAVTGWRDPYLAHYPAADRIRGRAEKSVLYGLVSGGVQNAGPAAFLYEVAAQDVTQWRYLNPLVQFPQNYCPDAKWTGDFGTNWEGAEFMTLRCPADRAYARDFVVFGAEGIRTPAPQTSLPAGTPRRPARSVKWLSGTLTREPGADGDVVDLDYDFGGTLDFGDYYAAASFVDARNRRIVFGWLPEEDQPGALAERKGWNGCAALPRELFLLFIPGVVRALRTPLEDVECCGLEDEHGVPPAPDQPLTGLRTLGIRPLPELARLRGEQAVPILDTPLGAGQVRATGHRGRHFELQAEIDVRPGCARAGFHVLHSADLRTRTSVYFDPAREALVVDRAASSARTDVNKAPELGALTLFTLARHGGEEQELLRLRVFVDADALEVYANDRFALSTRVYPDDPDADRVSAFADGPDQAAVFEVVNVWEMAAAEHSLLA